MGWKCAVDDEAVRVLLARPMRESTKLMDAIRGLAQHPTQPADFFGRDSMDRPLQALTVERYEIVFWVDHAVKEIRIVGVFLD